MLQEADAPAAPQSANRPSSEWYAAKIRETLDDDFSIGHHHSAPQERPSDAQIRGIAVCDGGLLQDEDSAWWTASDPALMKFARALLSRHGAAPQGGEDAEPNDECLALDLLETLFDAWENGVPCYEDPNAMAHSWGMPSDLMTIRSRRARLCLIAAVRAMELASSQPAGMRGRCPMNRDTIMIGYGAAVLFALCLFPFIVSTL